MAYRPQSSPPFPTRRSSDLGGHQHVESEIGRGYGSFSLKGELASMRARLIVESGAWSEMRGRTSFDNVDELFARSEEHTSELKSRRDLVCRLLLEKKKLTTV